MKGMTGLELCQRVVADRPDLPVIMLTAFGSFETAVGAIRAGAYDFVTKPVEIEALAIAVRRACEHRRLHGEVKRLREAVASTRGRGDLIGASPAMKRVHDLIEQVSATDATVLITGEAGTGKEAVARAVHEHSRRKEAPFIAINCAAAGESVVESFARARGGTLFLDDVAEVNLATQPALLHALQDRDADVRLVAATSRDLEGMVEDKQFREDLYYRINVISVPLPPLRARGGDVLLVADHLLRRSAAVLDKKVVGLSQAAAQRLLAYDWPGNVRELGNCIERAVATTRFEEIQVEDLSDKVRAKATRTSGLSGHDLPELLTLEEVERRHVLRVLEACNGNRTDAAKMLDLDRKTLYRKLLRWGVGDD
jgi:two-component system response regulator HydG